MNVAVIGDVMLDRYVTGECGRISPEAPVPVLHAQSTRSVPGGAANVAMNLAALGCQTTLIAGIGRDAAGRDLKRLVRAAGIIAHFDERPDAITTVKTRFVVGGKQLLRVDRESKWAGDRKWECSRLQNAAVLVLSDYNKGLLSPAVCRDWIAAARKRGIPVLVDPKGTDWAKYAGATCVKPNRAEFTAVAGCGIDIFSAAGRLALERSARALCRKFKLGSLLLTLGADGMAWIGGKRGDGSVYLPSQAKDVYDVSGAGDTSIAAFAAALGAGKSIEAAVRMANAAAGIAVSKVGTSVVTAAELGGRSKIVSLADCVRSVRRLRDEGKRIGFTNGCFDCCHLGHVQSIREARSQCDVLVVGVNSDAWIRAHKGRKRPLQDVRTRTAVLAAMADVDLVVVFGDETAERLVKAIRPDVIAKEGYRLADWPEGRLVKQLGGRVVSLKRIEGYSTTAMAERVK